MSHPQPADPYMIYLDSSFLVDLLVDTETRHTDAKALFELFKKHRSLLNVITSTWAIAEAHGRLYGLLLAKSGVKSKYDNVRNLLPPRTKELQEAKQKIDGLLADFETSTSFVLWPNTGADDIRIWQLAMQLGVEAAIWPADSVHLAIALYSGCSMIITDDRDFLDKIDFCYSNVIVPLRQAEFSYVPNLPTFEACGVDRTTHNSPPPSKSKHRPSAKHKLSLCGFK